MTFDQLLNAKHSPILPWARIENSLTGKEIWKLESQSQTSEAEAVQESLITACNKSSGLKS